MELLTKKSVWLVLQWIIIQTTKKYVTGLELKQKDTLKFCYQRLAQPVPPRKRSRKAATSKDSDVERPALDTVLGDEKVS